MKVWPKNETIRKILRHPLGKVGFHEQGPIEWPDDTFTYRRLQEGDITTEEPAAPETTAPQPPPVETAAPAEKKSKSSKSE